MTYPLTRTATGGFYWPNVKEEFYEWIESREDFKEQMRDFEEHIGSKEELQRAIQSCDDDDNDDPMEE